MNAMLLRKALSLKSDLYLPLFVTLLRPFVFVYVTRVALNSPSALAVAGSLSLYAIAPALAQSLSRANYIHAKIMPRKFRLLAVIVASLACATPSFLAASKFSLPAAIAIIITIVYSYVLFSESKLSTSYSAIIQSLAEVLIWLAAIILFRICASITMQIGIAIVFSFQLSAILSYLYNRFAIGSDWGHAEIVGKCNNDMPSYLSDVASGVAIQITASISGSAAIFVPAILRLTLNENAIIGVKVMHSIGAIMATAVNIYGPRMFYGDISDTHCKAILALLRKYVYLLPLLFLLSIFYVPRNAMDFPASALGFIVACGLLVALINLASSSFLYSKNMVLSLLCQLSVLLVSFSASLVFFGNSLTYFSLSALLLVLSAAFPVLALRLKPLPD
jgi:hypothetical protein